MKTTEYKIKTWEDIEKEGFKIFDDYREETVIDVRDCYEEVDCSDCICLKGYDYDLEKERPDNKIILKAIATLKIAKLIELGYGGIVTAGEWKNTNIEKYCVYAVEGKIDFNGYSLYEYHFIAFHTSEQREEFMSYSENVELIKQYFMIT